MCRWRKTKLLDSMGLKKRVFVETQDASACEVMLKDYQSHLRASSTAGALLVCVVGAKLSEGINFGDNLGRCVVVFGMPYPDMRDSELSERLRYADRKQENLPLPNLRQVSHSQACMKSMNTQQQGIGKAGREMYNNLCMNAVNQCVGRAIRHVEDFAAIVLVDARYCCGGSLRNETMEKLPRWVTRQWHECSDNFGSALRTLIQFYSSLR
jgi:chromosome transmission fidelity protein 1